MPVYAHKGKWLVRISWKGKRRSWTVEGRKKDAEAFEARKRVELERGAADTRTAPRFSEFSTRNYRDYAKAHLADGTWRNRRYQIATLVQHFGDKRLTEITAEDVEAFKTARNGERVNVGTEERPRYRTVGPAKVNDDLKVLRAILGYAQELGVPVRIPRIRKLPERGKRPPKAWTADEVAALYQAVERDDPGLMPIVVFLLNTGARKGEALALEWECVDLERGFVRIWPNEEWQPKDGEAREVPISTALRPWLEGPKERRQSPRWVFPSREGERFAFWPQRRFDAVRKAAGIEGGPHRTRHTFASHFLARQPDLFLLAKILGHSHERVTQLYSHLLPDHLERARDAVNLAPAAGPAAVEASRRWRRDA